MGLLSKSTYTESDRHFDIRIQLSPRAVVFVLTLASLLTRLIEDLLSWVINSAQ